MLYIFALLLKCMIRYLLIILLAFLPVLMYAQAVGGQIKRPIKKQNPFAMSKTVNKRSSSSIKSNKN